MNTELYDRDFYQWAMENSELMRQGKLSEIDVQNIAEELESMGRSERRELVDRLAQLIMHLLKWQYQPNRRSKSWSGTITEQRRKVELVLDDSPSLKYGMQESMRKAYYLAQAKFQKQTKIDRKILPNECPFTFEQVMNEDFWPE